MEQASWRETVTVLLRSTGFSVETEIHSIKYFLGLNYVSSTRDVKTKGLCPGGT